MTYLIKYDRRDALVEAESLRDAGVVAETKKKRGETLVGIHERPDLAGTAWRILLNTPELMHQKERR